jgi:short-subunit dehydrogenase
MRVLRGKTAVITGAASGIGAATAISLAKEGMNIVVSDVREDYLLKIEKNLKDIGANYISVRADVSDSAQIQNLATKTQSAFKTIDLLFNNAGVIHFSSILEHTEKDWQWVLGVNLFGAINCVRIIAPIMQEQGTDSHIINHASIGGFTTGPGLAAYKTSKHALIAFSEVLESELLESQINVSVLCPGWTDTLLMQSEITRPKRYINDFQQSHINQETKKHILKAIKSAKNGHSPEFISECLIEAIKNNKFYVIPDTSFYSKFKKRVDRIIEQN